MTATSTPPNRDKLHLQLARLFRNKIATGEWTIGQSIPTVEELEALHSVSRTTVRMAVHALVDEGLLQTRKRGGTKGRWPALQAPILFAANDLAGAGGLW